MVNSRASPSITASSGRNMGHRSPLFAVNEEERAEDGEVELADRPGPGPTPTRASLPNKQMSMASVQFDKGDKGFLTKDEKLARGMANKDGDVDKGSIVDLISQNRSLKMGQRRLAGLSLFLLAALVVTGALLGARLDQATTSTQVKIDEAVTTEIAQDGEGLPHLVDRASGGELTVRTEGDTFDTRQVVDPVTSRRLNCIPIHEVARMVNNLSHGVAGSVVEHDTDGASKKVVSFTGDFEDHGRHLQFGSFRIELDDDGCNRGADIPVSAPGLADGVATGPGETSLNAPAGPAATGEKKGVPAAPASEDASVDPGFVDDIGPTFEAAEGDGIGTRTAPSPSDADLFTRGLRLYAETPGQKASVLHRHRHAYDEAETSIREGRQLDPIKWRYAPLRWS